MKLRAIAVVVVLLTLGGACSSGSSSAKPDPLDVQAAQACQKLVEATGNKATPDQLLASAQPLIAGTAEAQASSQPAPKWAALGGDLVDAASAMSSQDATKLAQAGGDAANECSKIPSAAKKAGGYTK